jgi:hypothetical protein
MSEVTEMIPDGLPRLGVEHGFVNGQGVCLLAPRVPKARCSGWRGRGVLPKNKLHPYGIRGIF